MSELPAADGAGLSFDFITDERFRASLESDHAELLAALDAGASKAVMVLSGSIIEAVLVDYLQSTGQQKPDPLRMDLADLIQACTDAGVLSQRTAELSSVIRSYRNLIHPGRVARLSESFGIEDAQVASHVVTIVVRDVARQQALEFGLTAEQMVTKFETDHNAPGISKLLVSEMRPQDVRRLLIDVLPPRYFENAEHLDPDDPDEPSEERLARLQVLYRAAYDSASEDVQKAATKKYVSALREDSGSRVEIYDEAFFRSPDLTHLSRAERELVITHLLDRLKTRSTTSNSLLESCVGMSPYLNANQFRRFIDAYIRVIAYDAGISRRRIAREGLVTEYANHTTTEQDQRISKRLDEWVTTLRQREATNALSRIEKLRSELFPPDDGDIPF